MKRESRTMSGLVVPGCFRFAVCTKTGRSVDQHFGHAAAFYVYEYENGEIKKLEIRPVRQYCTGPDECDSDNRISNIINAIEDCDCVICLRIGKDPSQAILDKGISVIATCTMLETAIMEAARIMDNGPDQRRGIIYI